MTDAATQSDRGVGAKPSAGRIDSLPGPGPGARWALAATIAVVVGLNLAWLALREPPRAPAAHAERLLPMGDYPALRPWHSAPAPGDPGTPGTDSPE